MTPPTQDSLFGDEEAPAPSIGAVVRIARSGAASGMSPAQKAFNHWIATIEGQRKRLAEWQAFIPTMEQQVREQLIPLQQRLDAGRLAMLRLFDTALSGKGLGKRDRETLSEVLCNMAQDLLGHTDTPQVAAELGALHQKHAGVAPEEAQQEEADFVRSMAEDILGVRLDEADDARSAAEVLEAAMRRMEDEAQAASAARRPRRRSAKAQAREVQKEAERKAQADNATQSVREVYRKLASALHPDREPDAAERARKTALMQRVNQAYERKDLLALLELQMTVEQIDPSRLANVSEERLQHYVHVLKEQSQELDRELRELMATIVVKVPRHRPHSVTPAVVLSEIQVDAVHLRTACERLEEDLGTFQDLRALKAWIKEHRQATRHQQALDPIDMLLAAGVLGPAARSGRQR